MGRLLLVHFSDLHIGSTLTGSRHSWPYHALNGHELLYCQYLQDILADPLRPNSVPSKFQLQDNERLHFVLSGDLTRVGSESDFYLAYQWLLGAWALRNHRRPPREVGLRLPAIDLHCVPGNHDQWNGNEPRKLNFLSPPAFNKSLVPHWFKRTPWHVPIPSPDGDFTLDLFGVDSNSGLQGKLGSTFAEGAVSDQQLIELDTLLAESEDAERDDQSPHLRAIVCHHSFVGQFPTLGLRQKSIDALTALAHRYNVVALLTGHMHSILHDDHKSRGGHVFWELRAASAVQHGKQPGLQGFWVHELTCEQGRLGWQATLYEIDANKRAFTAGNKLPIL